MTVSIDRIFAIMSCLYGKNAEIVEEIDGIFTDHSIVFEWNGVKNNLSLDGEEVYCLEENGIIECDGGFGDERRVYVLTDSAQQRIRDIVADKKTI